MKNLKLRDGGWSTSASAEKKLKNIIPVASFVNASNSIMVMNLWEARFWLSLAITSTGSVIDTKMPKIQAPYQEIPELIPTRY